MIGPFRMMRDVDVSGVSGTGCVAEGIVFCDGRVALRWLTETGSTTTFDSLDDCMSVHSHDGRTRFVFGQGEHAPMPPAPVVRPPSVPPSAMAVAASSGPWRYMRGSSPSSVSLLPRRVGA